MYIKNYYDLKIILISNLISFYSLHKLSFIKFLDNATFISKKINKFESTFLIQIYIFDIEFFCNRITTLLFYNSISYK